jgi:hypothetical protein
MSKPAGLRVIRASIVVVLQFGQAGLENALMMWVLTHQAGALTLSVIGGRRYGALMSNHAASQYRGAVPF